MKQPLTTRTMNIILWIAQVLLAAMFLLVGSSKVFQPIDVLAQAYRWVPQFSPEFVRFIGISELLAVVGLLGPAATRILPRLTVFAAVGIMLLMAGATTTNALLGETFSVVLNVALFVVAALVAYGRWAVVPVPPRMGVGGVAPQRR